MKVFKFLVFACLFIFSFGCSNEFELIEEKKDIPIVYCLLDAYAEHQYLRLERAFASKTASALDLAKNPDSFYYKDAVVKLIKVAANGTTKTYTMKKIDGTSVGLPRNPNGIFATTPNILYTISAQEMPLIPGDKVKLDITTTEGISITSETTMIYQSKSATPNPDKDINFSETAFDNLRWGTSALSPQGKLYDIDLYFRYTEVTNGQEAKKSVHWPIITNSSETNLQLAPNAFYDFLKNKIEVNPNVKRYFDGIDYNITAGDVNYEDFIRVGRANTGITGSGELPLFSNVSNAVGLFGCKSTLKIVDLGLTFDSQQLLTNGKTTKSLNFQ